MVRLMPMENEKIVRKLRELSRNCPSAYKKTILKMAAQRICKLAADIEKTKALLAVALADLKEADANCAYCAHKSPPAPCAEDDEHYDCENCPHDCYCKDCVDNSKWEYQKTKEANQWTTASFSTTSEST